MNINDFTDEMIEQGKGATRRVIHQIVQDPKVSEVTGKPVPSKKVVSKISQEVNQLTAIRLEETRKELDKMKLQTSQNKSLDEIQKTKKDDDIVDQTLKHSLSTGENKGGGG